MAKRQSKRDSSSKRVPKVRIARPANRPFQLRYTDPATKKEVRVSCGGTRDEFEVARQKAELEAKLLLGIESKPKRKVRGPHMCWEDFREEYRQLHLVLLDDKSVECAESRLDIAERILKPRILSDVANAESLHQLQAQLLAGVESRFNRPRSPHSVRTYMNNIMGAVNWAHAQGWIEHPPTIRKVKVSKLKQMKGRALASEEFERMLAVTESIVGQQAAASWCHLLMGLWQSALRLDELMHTSWDIPNMIQPEWRRGRLPVLQIPSGRQKNATEEEIPLLPWFEDVLLKTPENRRKGWVFTPMSLETKRGHPVRFERPSSLWVGKVISRIGKRAGIVVDPGDERTGKPPKHASAHDLRRSCAERLLDAGVPPMVIARVLRHASWETTRRHYAAGDVQKDAGVLREKLVISEGVYLGTF